MANKYDIIKTQNVIPIKAGATYKDKITCTTTVPDPAFPDDRTKDTIEPFDLTGASVRSQLRDLQDKLICEFTCGTINEVGNLVPVFNDTGEINRELSAVDTASIVLPSPITKTIYVWGVEVTMASGAILPEIQGGATITPQVVFG